MAEWLRTLAALAEDLFQFPQLVRWLSAFWNSGSRGQNTSLCLLWAPDMQVAHRLKFALCELTHLTFAKKKNCRKQILYLYACIWFHCLLCYIATSLVWWPNTAQMSSLCVPRGRKVRVGFRNWTPEITSSFYAGLEENVFPAFTSCIGRPCSLACRLSLHLQKFHPISASGCTPLDFCINLTQLLLCECLWLHCMPWWLRANLFCEF